MYTEGRLTIMELASEQASEPAKPTLGIVAGSTDLPRIIAETCQKQGRPCFILALEDICEPKTVQDMPHAWSRIGALGHAMKTLKAHGAIELIMAGKVTRPKMANLRPDLKGTQLLAKLGSNFLKGDDELLRAVIAFLEKEGFTVVGAREVMPECLAQEGVLGAITPDKHLQADIEFGAKMARGIGKLDIGQSVIVQNHQVIGIEAIEGTAALIRRCAELKPEAKGGVLVKCCKPHQDERADLPTIGVATIEQCVEAKLSAIAIEAGKTLMLEKDTLIEQANAAGIAIVGIPQEDGQ